MYEYILAVVFLLNIQMAPQPIAAMKNKDDCMKQAMRMNATVEELRTTDARKHGAEFVCLKIERVNI